MGLKTLDGFRTDLQLALGNRGFTEPQLDNWINVGLADLVSQEEFEEMEVFSSILVAAGVNFFQPTNLEGIIGIANDTDKLALAKIDNQAWDRLDPNATGKPIYWMRRDSLIWIWPIPVVETNISFDTQGVEQTLVGPTETTMLQSMWDRAVHLLAMFHALTDLEEPNRALFFANGASRYIAKRIDLRKVDGRAIGRPVQPIDSHAEFIRQRDSRVILGG